MTDPVPIFTLSLEGHFFIRMPYTLEACQKALEFLEFAEKWTIADQEKVKENKGP